MYHVMNLKSPGEIWKKLEIQFMSKFITNKLYLKQRLYGLKMQEGSDLAQHVNVFNQIITDLACLDVYIEDEDRGMILLCSLLFSYEHLGNQDRGWKSEKKGSGKQNFRSKSRGRKTIHCYKCNEPGHMKRDCPKPKKQTDEKRDDSSKSANVCRMMIQTVVMVICFPFQQINEDRETIRIVKGALIVKKGKITAGNIYKLLGNTVVDGVHSVNSFDDNTKLWHMRLGHLSEHGMIELHKRNLLHGVKSCKLDFFFAKFKLWKAEVENQTGRQIKYLRSENGTEYIDSQFQKFCEENGIQSIFQYSFLKASGQRLDERSKLDPKSKQCIFLGYKKGVKGNKFWDPAARKMVISHDAVFDEQSMLQQCQNEMSKIGSSSDTLQMELEPHPVATENCYNLARDRQRRTNVKLPSRLGYEDTVSFALLVSGDEPTTFYGAITSQEKKKWMGVMVEEMEYLHKNQTWELVQLPEGNKTIGCKGSTCISSQLDLHLEQMDVKTTFLHGDLEEQIYMEQLDGFTQPGHEHLLLYVDYMLIAAKNMYDVLTLKALLSQEFDMKDLGAATKILGMEIHRDRGSRKLWLSQRGYVEKVLDRFGMSKAKPVSTPLANHFKLSIEQCPKIDREVEDMAKMPYASAVGCLMYAMVCTSPDLAQAVSQEEAYLLEINSSVYVALSTTEAKYMVVAKVAKEALWLSWLSKELGVGQGGVQLHCDSQSAIYLAKNQVYHARTKHIDVRYHKIRELIASGEIILQKVHTSENAADMLTKPLTVDKFHHCLDLLNIYSC
ncbi:Retrovirus-related Pol polyprotein from transposon TNT 1-94 [Sesamum angolense]|uniref:Retrovirus-related Pol polyprotein from transposon TNT 1-94 n=1 Tax=Sesamum angolense TaxID=2727404 RepID=A0AAE1XH73_9LAMI|nr:Retrovirus-related Pol polyprotein from transposon TNT 1-94 [Sesamum angolense]